MQVLKVKLKKKVGKLKARRLKNPTETLNKEKTPKPKKKRKKKMYFGKEAHNAVIRYQSAKDQQVRNKIYVDEIKPSFDKLAENLIFIHGFSSDKHHFEILKADCVTFLYEILEKFDPVRGSKAFSYFNVCAKNFLIIQSKKRTKNRNRHVSIDDDNLSNYEKRKIEHYNVEPSQEDMIIRKEDKEILIKILQQIKNKTINANEIACIDAIIVLFSSIEDLDFFNKRAVFVYLREISGLNPKQLSVAMSNLRKYYRELVKSNFEFILFAT